MYSLHAYGEMIFDTARVDAYRRALTESIRPGVIVLEIGTGPGVFAVLACQLGARRVYAVEPAEIIQVAREIAAANACADRIEFIEDLSTQISLPERADIILSDLRGVLPLYPGNLTAIIDARERFLAPGGILMPRRDTISAAVLEAPDSYKGIVGHWDENTFKQDLSPARRLAVNQISRIHAGPEQYLTNPKPWSTLDYCSVEETGACGELDWITLRAGIGHGITAWFETELIDGVGYAGNVVNPRSLYGSLLFPWPQPVPLAKGQAIHVRLEARLLGEDYIWRWTTSMEMPDGSTLKFDQSTLHGSVQSPAQLRKGAASYVPHLSDDGLIDRRVLELMNGRASLDEIAGALLSDFPGRFAKRQDAFARVSRLSTMYSKPWSGESQTGS